MVEMLFQMQCNSSVYLELDMPKKTNPLEVPSVTLGSYLRYPYFFAGRGWSQNSFMVRPACLLFPG